MAELDLDGIKKKYEQALTEVCNTYQQEMLTGFKQGLESTVQNIRMDLSKKAADSMTTWIKGLFHLDSGGSKTNKEDGTQTASKEDAKVNNDPLGVKLKEIKDSFSSFETNIKQMYKEIAEGVSSTFEAFKGQYANAKEKLSGIKEGFAGLLDSTENIGPALAEKAANSLGTWIKSFFGLDSGGSKTNKEDGTQTASKEDAKVSNDPLGVKLKEIKDSSTTSQKDAKVNSDPLGADLKTGQTSISSFRDSIKQMYTGIAEGLSATFNVFKGQYVNVKEMFSDLLNSVTQNISQVLAQKAASSIANWISGLFMASGGPVDASRPYIVGEAGPELFIPSTSGTIIPNNALNGGGNVSVNIINNSGSQVTARVTSKKTDSAGNQAITLVMEQISRNANGSRDFFKALSRT